MRPAFRKLLIWAQRDGIAAHQAFAAPLVEQSTWVVPYGPRAVRPIEVDGRRLLPIGTDPHDVATYGYPRTVPSDLISAWLAHAGLHGLLVDPEGPQPTVLDRWSVFRRVGVPGVCGRRPLPVSSAHELQCALDLFGWSTEDRIVELPGGEEIVGRVHMREPTFDWHEGLAFVLVGSGGHSALDVVGWSLAAQLSEERLDASTPGSLERAAHLRELLGRLHALRAAVQSPERALHDNASRLIHGLHPQAFTLEAIDARITAASQASTPSTVRSAR